MDGERHRSVESGRELTTWSSSHGPNLRERLRKKQERHLVLLKMQTQRRYSKLDTLHWLFLF